jgi:hypothetical protein
MNVTSWLLLIAVCAALSGVTWWGTVWWYSRKIDELQRKLEKARKVASVNSMQARHQISKLQRQVAAYQSEIDAHQKIQEAWKSLQAEPAGRSSAAGAGGGPALPVHGFADTQPL